MPPIAQTDVHCCFVREVAIKVAHHKIGRIFCITGQHIVFTSFLRNTDVDIPLKSGRAIRTVLLERRQ